MNDEKDQLLPGVPVAVSPAPAARTGRRARAAVLGAALLTAGLALTACAGDKDGERQASNGDVASLETSSPGVGARTASPGSADAAVEAKRPVLRLDSSAEEADRLWDVYWACLQAHGVPMNEQRVETAGDQAPPVQDQKVADQYKAQYRACLYKMPLQPVEERPETNPHYADDYRAYVGCLRDKGVKVHEVFAADGSPDGWTFDDDYPTDGSGPYNDKLDNDCRLEAFGGHDK
ncbi:hypothetical protein ACIPSE_13050 [Streptomyces sp. NPDC090106]|uniref:hypothetical protein n=1 Tax=Streptomyces sp. NPDC090106 TaxID=3365946 RepID=UPI00382FCF3C